MLTEVRRFQIPIPYRGAQGFFSVPDTVVEGELIKLALDPMTMTQRQWEAHQRDLRHGY